MARLFVAAVPPPDVLGRLAADLARPALAGVRYTGPQQWHVTLRFLGRAPLGEATAALAGLRADPARARLGPATVRLGRRVVCLPVDGLAPLAEVVAQATAHIGRPLERRPFAGHLTLARLDPRRAADGNELVGVAFEATFGVTEIHLVRSRTRPEGAVYDTVATRSLAGEPAGAGG